MTTPVLLLAGVDPDALATATVGLQWELPRAVAVRHRVDVESQVLERMVSDATGEIERVTTDLEHACVPCALRKDVLPTLERLAVDGRWGSVIAHLPVGADPRPLCRVLDLDPGLPPRVHVSAVVACVDGPAVLTDVLGDDLLAERGLHSSSDDRRGVGETLAAMVEYADAVAVAGDLDPAHAAYLAQLARPGVPVRPTHELEGLPLVTNRRDHGVTESWAATVLAADPHPSTTEAWTLDLRSTRPFHPERLLEHIAGIGGGPHRSRGCFWLPSRPDVVGAWDGAGGQLSLGTGDFWGRRPQRTRIWVTGHGTPPASIPDTFRQCLLSDTEIARRGRFWEVGDDGFEAWLGPVRRAA